MQELELPKKHPTTDHGEREFDKTQLREAGYGYKVHRDYAAHFFRWGFASNLVDKGMKVLDVGCGQDLPFYKVLTGHMSCIPERMLAVDYNPITKKPGTQWLTVKDKFNFIENWNELLIEFGQFDLATCFEVIEHMQKGNGDKLLEGLKGMLKPEGTLILSTPVYNEKHMAANHIHEYRFEELKDNFQRAGLKVERVHGTFMTSQSLKRVCTKEELALVEELHQWHGWDVLSTFLAPKYPEASSNCCWILKKA
jgi:SAM-dependent methyltransferase